MRIFDATLGTLERALDVRLARQTVLASNIANADTPGFKPRELDFASAMAATGPGATASPGVELLTRAGDVPLARGGSLAATAPERFVAEVPGAAAGLDGNAVDVDRTLAAVAENGIQYGVATRAASKKLAILRYVANDGNG